MNQDMVKSKKCKDLYLVYYFTAPLNAPIEEIAVISTFRCSTLTPQNTSIPKI